MGAVILDSRVSCSETLYLTLGEGDVNEIEMSGFGFWGGGMYSAMAESEKATTANGIAKQ